MPEMSETAGRSYVDVEQAQTVVADVMALAGDGPLFMLNLLRFKPIADYADAPHLAPAKQISGAAATGHYMKLCEDRLKARADQISFLGRCGPFMIGPPDEHWDAVLIIRRPSLTSMISGMSDDDYPTRIAPHRAAALADSRLLPMVEGGPGLDLFGANPA